MISDTSILFGGLLAHKVTLLGDSDTFDSSDRAGIPRDTAHPVRSCSSSSESVTVRAEAEGCAEHSRSSLILLRREDDWDSAAGSEV